MKAAKILNQCKIELADMPEAERITASVLSWLSQEHIARQMLCRLPNNVAVDPWLRQVNLLFANFFSECHQYCARKNLSVLWQPLYDNVLLLSKKTPQLGPSVSPRAVNRQPYIATIRQCLASIKAIVVGSVDSDADFPESLRLSHLEFSHLLQEVENLLFDARYKKLNKRAVPDWWFCLEDLPPLAKKVQQQLYDALFLSPLALRDEQLDRLELIFLNTGIASLKPAQQASIVTELPLLLVEAQASENLAWLLTENGFIGANQLSAHVHLFDHIDMLRCFMPKGVETLQVLSSCLKQFPIPEKSAFWDLLNLKSLKRAADLAVKQGVPPHPQPLRQSVRSESTIKSVAMP